MGNEFDIVGYIKRCCTVRGISSVADISRATGMTMQSICNKYSRKKFSNEDLDLIADALGADLQIQFIDRQTGQPL